MRPLLCSPLAIALIAGAAVPQTESSTATNLGLATTYALVDGDWEALVVPENLQGGTDLNGDGDALDAVLHLHDAVAGTTTNLGIDVGFSQLLFEKGILVFTLDETVLGADLNGDGDALDFTVLHHYDVRAGVLTNVGLATTTGTITDGRRILALVGETQQGATDLNGDGDTLDDVVHLYDIAGGTTTNLGLASFTPIALAGDLVAISVPEFGQGNADLNKDGDTMDFVMHLYDHQSGTTTNLGLYTLSFYLEPGHLAFQVFEGGQGNTDLNGDGDTSDVVLHHHDVAAGTTTNVGLSSGTLVGDAGNVAFTVSEWSQSADLNGDGDLFDFVTHVRHLPSGTNDNLGFAGTTVELLDGHRLVWFADEAGHGATDLNGDGDALDTVLLTRDLVERTTTSVGLASFGPAALASNLLVAQVDEAFHGNLDLNGDGDALDGVLHLIDLRTGATTNLSVATQAQLWGEGTSLLFAVSEAGQGGTDLNGDGDALDDVLHTWDPAAGAIENLGVVASIPYQDSAGDRNLVGATVFELSVGTDLNGDGDLMDNVGYLLTLDVPHGLVGDGDRSRLSAGDPQTLLLDAGPSMAGDLYVLVGSFSGTTPGIPFGKVVLPLNWDAYMQFTFLNPNTPILSNSFALLDGLGESTARFQLPAGSDPTLAGVTLHHAYLVIDLSTFKFSFASNAFGVKLVS